MNNKELNEELKMEESIIMDYRNGKMFSNEPKINVISKEEFEVRVQKIFHLLWETLSKSFGPYGAPTLICKYPYRHVTKDGYTIMKHLSFDASETKVDQAISDMAEEICGRLNYSVGDGTTSAIIATNSIYQNYMDMKSDFADKYILPRDIIKKYDIIKENIITKLKEKSKQIRTDDLDELYKRIYDVVFISSNGDEEMTENIANLYKELGAPAISCIKSPDGITRVKLIDGYKYELSLADRLYINSDEKTMELADSDVIIFSTKITENTYVKILKPLNNECMIRGRHLIVCAPSYDEMALNNIIAPDLNAEYRKRHDVNLVLTRYRAVSGHSRRLINDFSILMNTDIIDRNRERDIIDKLATGLQIGQVINIDNREIYGSRCIAVGDKNMVTYIHGVDEIPAGYTPISSIVDIDDTALHLGYVKSCSLGLTSSIFNDLVYDKERYDVAVKEAEDLLEEAERKYQKLGTFNVEVSQCQERFFSLKMKMGIIEVGADSDISQDMIKDSVDDAVKAAESAYKHGVVLGCNTNLIQVIKELYEESTDETEKSLLKILLKGFKDVYRTVLSNAFDDVEFTDDINIVKEYIKNHFDNIENIFPDNNLFNKAYEESIKDDERDNCINENYGLTSLLKFKTENKYISLHNIIINYSILSNSVFDVSTFQYSKNVINSLQTDTEILKATIDLISILIVGNQMVVTQKHMYEA